MDTFLQGLAQGVAIGGIYGLITMALTAVYSVTRLLNFAHGDLMAVAMYMAFAASSVWGIGPYASIVFIAPAMVLLGAALFYLVFARMLRSHVLLVIQVTLGIGFVIQSLLLVVFSANYRTVPSGLAAQRLFVGPVILQAPYVVAFAVSITLALLFYGLLHHTEFGRHVRAVAEDADAAALSGINVRHVQLLVFAGSLGVLGVVGPLVTPIFILEPTVGLHHTLIAFIVLILGGVTNFLGTFVAGIIIGVAEALGALYINPPAYAAVMPYLIFILFLLIKPSGVLSRS